MVTDLKRRPDPKKLEQKGKRKRLKTRRRSKRTNEPNTIYGESENGKLLPVVDSEQKRNQKVLTLQNTTDRGILAFGSKERAGRTSRV